MTEMQIESAKIEDALYAAFGVSAEEIELTLIHYESKEDSEVMQAIAAKQDMMERFEYEHTHWDYERSLYANFNTAISYISGKKLN